MAARTEALPPREAPPAPERAADGAAPPAMDIGEFYRIAMRRRRLLAPCMAVAGALCLAYVLLTPTRYTASMSLLIDPRERMPIGVDAPPMPQNPDVALVESQMRILTSRAVLRRVVDSQGLLTDADYAPGLVSQLIAGVTGLFSSRSPAPDARLDELADVLAREITTKRGERTYIIDVDVKGHTPEKAVKLAKALTDAFFANQVGMADEVVARQTAWLDGRLNDLRTRVDAAERRAQDYRDAQSIVTSDGHISPEQQLRTANDALVVARGKRSEIESRYQQLKAAMAHGGRPESITDAIRSPVIEKLRADQAALARDEAYERTVLGPRHPSYLTTKTQLGAVQAQIAAELQRIELATERELKSAKSAEQDAAGLVSTLEASTGKVDDRRVELGQLESQAATLRATYEKLMTGRENIRHDVVESPTTTIIDPPVAGPAKTSPRTTLAGFIALAGALNLWILAALVAEYRDSTRLPAPASPSPLGAGKRHEGETAPAAAAGFDLEVPDFAGANLSIPQSQRRQKPVGIAIVETAMRDDAKYCAAIDKILQQANESCGAGEVRPVIAIIAQARGAGASTLALSLAYAACARGTRVLLVDRDFGQPGLTLETKELRRTPLGRPGQIARVVHRDEATDGEILLVPFDERGDLLPDARLKSRFDLILLDCGPLAQAAGLLADADSADALIVVDRIGADARGIAEELNRSGIAVPIIGIIRAPAIERLRRSA